MESLHQRLMRPHAICTRMRTDGRTFSTLLIALFPSLPDAEDLVESLGPLLEGPIPSFDVVPDAERQGNPVDVQPLEGACVPWGVVDYEQWLPLACLSCQFLCAVGVECSPPYR